MPYVNIKVAKGPSVLTPDKKRAIVAGITRILADVLGKKPEHTHIVLEEIEPDDWGFAGVLVSEYRQAQNS